MSSCDQLRALMTKNFLLMKRNYFATACEVLFPILLMILLALVKSLFAVTDVIIETTDKEFFLTNSSAYYSLRNISQSGRPNQTFYGINAENARFSFACLRENRSTIGLVGEIPNENLLTYYFKSLNFSIMQFNDSNHINSYTASENYGINSSFPQLCFGLSLNQINIDNYNYSLHYFDAADEDPKGTKSIPNQLLPSLNPFQNGPALSAFNKWRTSGYLEMVTIINNMILQLSTNDNQVQINSAISAEKFSKYKNDPFAKAIGFILPFFLIIAYVCPLVIVVFRMVSDKETRAKEGMKIMGLSEGVYFNSYFLQYLIMNTLYSLINSAILLLVFKHIPYGYIFLFFWLYGLSVFALGFFFQSFIDKTRIAVVLSLIIYFIMYFVCQGVLSNTVPNWKKIAISIFPPSCLALGVVTMAQFESAFLQFNSGYLNFPFQNYTVGNMYTMLSIDIVLYLFIGFYFQNVISHQFGSRKPFYFLCSRRYWCKKKKSSVYEKMEEIKEKLVSIKFEESEFFQNEDNYEELIKSGECLRINDIVKVYDDGKKALNGVNLNIYNNEIFALLGHNGAGKSTLISILCGLYEATGGSAYYQNEEVLTNMDEFRKNLGICPQHDVLFDRLTQKEHLDLFAVYKGIPAEKRAEEVEKIMEEMGIKEKENCLVEGLSGGQKRKLSIAIALLGGSKIVFLDEPSSGMDITSRRQLWDILKKSCSNKIIVLTTHYMEEASVLGNRIGIVSNGVLKCSGTSLFLIDKFGKYISLTIAKEKEANDDNIINFIQERIQNIEYEVLNEEILFKIPKRDYVNLKEFFNELDQNLANLNIKSYGASLPTLEDVFLNVSADLHTKHKHNEKSRNSLPQDNNGYSYDTYDRSKEGEVVGLTKFGVDLKASLYKRSKQLIRDYKSFVLEVICPIILCIIGLFIANIEFVKNSFPKEFSLGLLPSPQITYYNKLPFGSNDLDTSKIFPSSFDQSFVVYENTAMTTPVDELIDYNVYLFSKSNTNSLAGYFVLNYDQTNKIYDTAVFVNMQAQDSAPIFYQDHFNKMINAISGRNVKISSNVVPLPSTFQNKNQNKIRNSTNLCFFLSIAFALIPANFITIIIREREQNTKHLQIISGISLIAYWLSNFIFELVKYFVTGGICLSLMQIFGQCTNEMWLFYVIYGFSMVPFSYIFSFIFKKEASAQNLVILLNFLFGSLGGTIVFVLRTNSSTVNSAKFIANIMRIVPAFSLNYSYVTCLSTNILRFFDGVPEVKVLSLDYAGTDLLYLIVIGSLSILTIILCEVFQTNFSFTQKTNALPQPEEILDQDVRDEIDLVMNKTENKEFAVEVRNIEKNYSALCTEKMPNSVNKLSFHLKKGECFALLGLNGAGKTTTFKCLTCEIFPTKGEIIINGLELESNFQNVRNMIGYCPQFDAIFDYMTVYENLYFYSSIKGIPANKRDLIANSLMQEMDLIQFRDKQSGNLSGGNKRKLSVAIALIGNPQIVLLDEPSTGVDPEARRFMWSVIHKISVTRKQSSVILTTHSMEEAETLCRRMGIMVKGQFRCLGTSQSIKTKYGEGYEIDLRINNVKEDILNKSLNDINMIKDDQVEEQNLNNILEKLGKAQFRQLIKPSGVGAEIYEDFSTKKACSIKRIINWVYFTENLMNLCGKLIYFYEDITIAEFYDNNFKLKLRSPSPNLMRNTIGFLFSLFEDYKNTFDIAEYGISQASLEQIFNKFAKEIVEKEESNVVHFKTKIQISKDLIDSIVIEQ